MADEKRETIHTERYLWELYVLIGGIIALSALALLGNLPRMAAWLLALLALGVGQAFLFPASIGFLGAILVIVTWVIFRQVTGIWTPAAMLQNLLEMAGLSLNIYLAIRFRQVWQKQQDELKELRVLKQLLVTEDVGAGLLPPEIGELRILEEIDRARQFHRPLGLLTVEISPLSETVINGEELQRIFMAFARQISSASLVHDIPFRQSASRIGVILPERNWEQLYRDADLMARSISKATFLDQKGQAQLIRNQVKFAFGLGTYQGEASGEIDLVQAAQDSLDISRDMADMGESSVSTYAMPATPIVESGRLLTDAEE